MNLFKIAFSNIKKRKSSAITLVAITTIAVLVLALSLTLLIGVGNLYDDKVKKSNTADVTFWHPMNNKAQKFGADTFLDFIKNYNKTKIEYETEYGFIGDIKYQAGKNTKSASVMFLKENENRKMDTYTTIDKLAKKPDNGIILPLMFKLEGYKSNDKFSIQIGSKTYEFKIYGFFEDLQYGNVMTNMKRAYITSDSIFSEMFDDLRFEPRVFVALNFENFSSDYDVFGDELRKRLDQATGLYGDEIWFSISGINNESVRSNVTMFPTVVAYVLILVSAIVILVALIIARFTIINNIEEDVKTLGALKSIGFTTKQIKLAMVLQFLIIAILGAVFGAALTIALDGVVGNIVSSTAGLLWSGSAMTVPIIIAVLAVIGVVTLTAYLMARRSKKVTPINALRQGLSNHTFKKNAVPLEKSKMPLSLNIAAKNLRNNLKNNITAFIMVCMFGFITVLSFTLYHNFITDKNAFKQITGTEVNAIEVSAAFDDLEEDWMEKIEKQPNVRKTLKYSTYTVLADGIPYNNAIVWDDFGKKEANALIKGSYPKFANQIAIPLSLKNMIKKVVKKDVDVGNWITLKTQGFGGELDGVPQEYQITGITNVSGFSGCDLTKEGFLRLNDGEDIEFYKMYVYLEDNSKEAADKFKSWLADEFGSREILVQSESERLDGILEVIETPLKLAIYMIVIIEIFVVCLIFFLMVNTIIRRRKKDAGIMKALGFTSRQLILQTFLSFLPVILAGVLFGAIAGVLLVNPLLGVLLANSVAKAAFTIPPTIVTISAIALTVVCVLTVCLVSFKFKRIVPQKLIVDG